MSCCSVHFLNKAHFALIAVGWGRDSRNEGFGDKGGVKYQLVSLITSVQTLLRGAYNNTNILKASSQ